MRFLVTHPLAADLTADAVGDLLKTAQTDPDVKGYRSFLNLTTHKGVCIFDAPDRDRLAKWLDDSSLPYDDIMPVEIEGDRGTLVDIPIATPATAAP